MKHRVPDAISEQRLEELRRQAEQHGRVDGKGVHPQGSPMPSTSEASALLPDESSANHSYCGLPLLKAPVWTWEIPLYFFVGGTAGAAAVLAVAAHLTGADRTLVRDARWIACIGANLSAPLLISDLGRPERFLNMMRVFKLRSPMSVGAWTLAVFGASSTVAAFAEERSRRVRRRRLAETQTTSRDAIVDSPGPPPTTSVVQVIGDLAGLSAAASGLGMATYTGVLLGATAIPVWTKHAKTLPIHFGASALASAASLLQLLGHDEPALNMLAMGAAAFEVYTGIRIERDASLASEPLRHGTTGVTTRIGAFFSGPLPLILRLFGARSRRAREAAAASALLGSMITRFAWVEAGKESTRDPRAALD